MLTNLETSMKRVFPLKLLSAYFLLGVVGMSTKASALENDGAALNNASLTGYLAELTRNAAPNSGYCNFKSIASSTTVTLDAATLPGGIAGAFVTMTGSTATALTLDTTDLIVSRIPGAFVGQTAPFFVANASSATMTLTVGDTRTTLSGTTTVTTVAMRAYQVKVTNLANPNADGAAATNTTTTTAAVAAQVPSTTVTTTVIPVTASTGMATTGSVLRVTQADGTYLIGKVTAINSLNITISAVNTKAIASGATVSVWNPAVTVTAMFAIDHTTGVIA